MGQVVTKGSLPAGSEMDLAVAQDGGLVDAALTMLKYTGSGYTYLCEASPNTARSGATWRVMRITDATGDTVYAGAGKFEHAATDLATVAALTYTLGA